MNGTEQGTANAAKKVVIIGAGIGGLGLAAMLGKKGYEVTVVEKNDTTGGRARVWEKDGFLFDLGPSWYMMPDVFGHFFDVLGEKESDYYTLQRLGPSYRIFLKSDNSTHDFYSEPEKIKALFESLEPGAGDKLARFLASTEEQYAIAKREFMYKNYNSFFDFINFKTMKIGMKLPIFKNQRDIIESRFKNELIRKAMQYQTILLGTAPGDTPGIYSMMNYVDFVEGIWYPKSGIRAIPESLTALAQKYGATIRCNAPVQKILVADDSYDTDGVGTKTGPVARGVRLENGEEILADIVVSNADVWHTDTALLPHEHRVYDDAYWDSRTLAPSAMVLFLGVKGRVPSLAHHNLLFAEDWEASFSQIFGKTPQWPTDPSISICVPSYTDSTVAPADCENLFVLVPMPAGLSYTEEEADKYEAFVLGEIAKHMGVPDIAERLLVRRRYFIKEFMQDYNAHKGTALGLAHTLMQTAIFRPNNIHPKIKNLFAVGAGTNPGIGMPICLISAELAYKRIEGIEHPYPLEKI